MLTIKNLKASYNGLQILKDINLNLEKGQVLSVIGESGTGKTTLGRAVMGLLESRCTGEILFKGKNLLTCPEEERRRIRGREIAMVFQNVEDGLHPLYSILYQVMEAVLIHGLTDKKAAEKRACEVLELVGLDNRRSLAYPHQLSGGEKQRALIALAVVNNPDILILDEPTASLDALTKAEIIAVLRRITREKASLVITHDISTAADLSTHMAVLYGGRIVELGATGDMLTGPRHPYTRGLLRSYPNMTTTKDLQGIPGRMSHHVEGCPFHPRCTQRIRICSAEAPLPAVEGNRLIACHRGGIVPLLEVRCSKSFGPLKVLQDVECILHEGETLALIGESGSGKTTLAKTVMGLLKADEEEIRLEGKKVTRRTIDFYKRIQMIFQNPGESISHRMNVLQTVKEPLDIHKTGNEEEKLERVRQVLNEVELPGDDAFLKKYPHHLSGGEAQRVAIARALVLNPKVLIADESTSALDASVQAKILKLMMNLQEKRGLSIMFITHDLALAKKISDRLAVLLKGRIVEEGPTSEIIYHPLHPYTRALIDYAPLLEDRSARPAGSRWARRTHSGTCGNSLQAAPRLKRPPSATSTGCPYANRCLAVKDRCLEERPELIACSPRKVACFYPPVDYKIQSN